MQKNARFSRHVNFEVLRRKLEIQSFSNIVKSDGENTVGISLNGPATFAVAK
jgi:hypothetical protein